MILMWRIWYNIGLEYEIFIRKGKFCYVLVKEEVRLFNRIEEDGKMKKRNYFFFIYDDEIGILGVIKKWSLDVRVIWF